MIYVVKFERKENEIEIGFRQGIAVVYASVSSNLKNDEAKQKAYEQVKTALKYEQTRETPSFTVPDEEDEDGNVIEFEKFIPADPTVKEITIHGDSYVSFEDDSPSKTIELSASAIDQYSDPIEMPYEWIGANNGVLKVDNVDGTYGVSIMAGGITASINVVVHAYRAPEPSEVDLLAEYVVDVDFRVAMLELGF